MVMAEQGERQSLEEALRMLEDEAAARGREKSGCPEVYLNVYDMLAVNSYTYQVGLGAFHTGVEVFGREYAYGSHPYSYTGIYDMEPRRADKISNQVRFREAIHLGHTHLSSDEVKELVASLSRKYCGCDYNILHRNCNHFTTEFCQRLCGTTPPRWVNRLAQLTSWMPFVLRCLPPQLLSSPSLSPMRSLQPPTANQEPDDTQQQTPPSPTHTS